MLLSFFLLLLISLPFITVVQLFNAINKHKNSIEDITNTTSNPTKGIFSCVQINIQSLIFVLSVCSGKSFQIKFFGSSQTTKEKERQKLI